MCYGPCPSSPFTFLSRSVTQDSGYRCAPSRGHREDYPDQRAFISDRVHEYHRTPRGTADSVSRDPNADSIPRERVRYCSLVRRLAPREPYHQLPSSRDESYHHSRSESATDRLNLSSATRDTRRWEETRAPPDDFRHRSRYTNGRLREHHPDYYRSSDRDTRPVAGQRPRRDVVDRASFNSPNPDRHIRDALYRRIRAPVGTAIPHNRYTSSHAERDVSRPYSGPSVDYRDFHDERTRESRDRYSQSLYTNERREPSRPRRLSYEDERGGREDECRPARRESSRPRQLSYEDEAGGGKSNIDRLGGSPLCL